MENNNQMVQVFNKAIADSGIQIYLYRDDMYCEWKADVDTSLHDKQIRAEVIDKIENLRTHYVDACNMCTSLNCEQCNINQFIEDLEQLKEQK